MRLSLYLGAAFLMLAASEGSAMVLGPNAAISGPNFRRGDVKLIFDPWLARIETLDDPADPEPMAQVCKLMIGWKPV